MSGGDIRLIQVGRCGYCGLRWEEYDPAHLKGNCWRKVVLEEREKDPTYHLKRIADALEEGQK